MKQFLIAILFVITWTVSTAAQEQPRKSLGEIAKDVREARLRKDAEAVVDRLCSNTKDEKVQERCKDKPALIQLSYELQVKKDKEDTEKRFKLLEKETSRPVSSADRVSAAKSKVQRACDYSTSAKPADVLDCAKAEGELADALETQSRTPNQGTGGEVPRSGDYVISLTGTAGLPVTGTCSFAGKSMSFDDVLPAEHTATPGRGIICSFVKKYVQGTLRMQIIQNGTLRDQAETDASYGVVSLSLDY